MPGQHIYDYPAPSLTEFTFKPNSNSFDWPSSWFDVPRVSPGHSLPQTHCQRAIFKLPQYAPEPDLDAVPELDHSKTPDSLSPTQLHESCITPPQEAVSAVSICDVPLLAPRPIPYTPPTFLQFDYLPEDDEDLSYPPYTHSRKHRKRRLHASTPVSTPSAAVPASQDALLLPSSKRRRLAEPYSQRLEPAVVGLDASWALTPQSHHHHHYSGAAQPPYLHFYPQLVDDFGRSQSDAAMMGWI